MQNLHVDCYHRENHAKPINGEYVERKHELITTGHVYAEASAVYREFNNTRSSSKQQTKHAKTMRNNENKRVDTTFTSGNMQEQCLTANVTKFDPGASEHF